MPAPLRDVPQESIDLIRCFEGIPDGDPSTVDIDAYLCPASVWTIGWGHAIMDGGVQLKGPENKARARALYPGGITRAQAEALLRGDLIPRAASVSSLLKVPVNDNQFGALIGIVFNIGVGNLAASTLLRKLNAGDFDGAADQFLVWDKVRVNGVLKPMAGLTRRRRAERAMFEGGDWPAVAALPVTRGRARDLEVLPVPEAPADQAVVVPSKRRVAKRSAPRKAAVKQAAPKKAPPKKSAAKKVTARKAAAKKSAVKKAAPRKSAVKTASGAKAAGKPRARRRARTTTPKAPPPVPTTGRPAQRKPR